MTSLKIEWICSYRTWFYFIKWEFVESPQQMCVQVFMCKILGFKSVACTHAPWNTWYLCLFLMFALMHVYNVILRLMANLNFCICFIKKYKRSWPFSVTFCQFFFVLWKSCNYSYVTWMAPSNTRGEVCFIFAAPVTIFMNIKNHKWKFSFPFLWCKGRERLALDAMRYDKPTGDKYTRSSSYAFEEDSKLWPGN